jgi:hypothetical protein
MSASSPEPISAVRLVAQEPRRVVLRLHGAEEIELGTADRRDPAMAIAREMVAAIEAATSRGHWPEIGDRLIRPGAIVSVDVQRGR